MPDINYPDPFSIPRPQNQLFQNISQGTKDLAQYISQKRAEKDVIDKELKLITAKATAEQIAKQSDPLEQILRAGQAGKAFSDMTGSVPPQLQNYFQGLTQPSQQGNPQSVQPSGNIQGGQFAPPIGNIVSPGGQSPISNGMNPIVSSYQRTPIGNIVPDKIINPLATLSEKMAGEKGTQQAQAEQGTVRDKAQYNLMIGAIKNNMDIYNKLYDKGFAGDKAAPAIASNLNMVPRFGGLQESVSKNLGISPDVQKNIGNFTASRNEMLVKMQPFLSQQFGQAGTSRIMESLIHLAQAELGNISDTKDTFIGKSIGTAQSLNRILQASKQYENDLKAAGQPLPQDENVVASQIAQRMQGIPPLDENQIVKDLGISKSLSVNNPPSSFNEGQTATNPKTGQKVIFKGGQWQPIQ